MIVILYEHDGQTAVMVPSPEFPGDALCVAEKDVSDGVPFLLVEQDDLPEGNPEIWDVDYSSPDGIGLTIEDWLIKYPQFAPQPEDDTESVQGE